MKKGDIEELAKADSALDELIASTIQADVVSRNLGLKQTFLQRSLNELCDDKTCIIPEALRDASLKDFKSRYEVAKKNFESQVQHSYDDDKDQIRKWCQQKLERDEVHEKVAQTTLSRGLSNFSPGKFDYKLKWIYATMEHQFQHQRWEVAAENAEKKGDIERAKIPRDIGDYIRKIKSPAKCKR